MALYQCVPNLSEGRRPELMERIRHDLATVPGVCLADVSQDADHHRMVVSLLGPALGLKEAMFRLFALAMDEIDLSQHTGGHPRIGAVDVVPFVPLGQTSMESAVELAQEVGRQVAERFDLPVFLYEEAALRPEYRRLPDLRGPGLAERVLQPDFGPPRLHPRLGASVIGARKPLVAYNIVLESANMEAARRIARGLRETQGGFPGVRAIAVWLESQQRAQISINLVTPQVTGFLPVFEAVRREATALGIEVRSSELIGLTPLAVLAETARQALRMHDFKLSQILETHLCPEPT